MFPAVHFYRLRRCDVDLPKAEFLAFTSCYEFQRSDEQNTTSVCLYFFQVAALLILSCILLSARTSVGLILASS
jgi:hypothetical protein